MVIDTLSFSYFKQGYYLRPMIPIRLSFNGNILDTVGILDSGSDFSIIPKSIAEILHLPLGKKEKYIILIC